MLESRIDHAPATQHARFSVNLATTPGEVEEAQRLRWRVFAEEMGARLDPRTPGVDRDFYDAHCDHLLVRETDGGEVVGTYRLLTPEAAKKVGGYYSEQEFDLTRFNQLRPRMVELGRSCVHPDHRSGAVIALLWSGIADYMRRGGYEHLIGCASVSMADGGHVAASIYHAVTERALSPIEWRAFPRCRLPLEALDMNLKAPLPPLIKGYLRAGAYVCGEPAWDPDFNTADLFMLLPLRRLDQVYARRFLQT
jgi:putative hemolysin